MKRTLLGLFGGLFLALPLAAAQPVEEVVISPQAIVVNPLPAFEVEVFVDRDASGEAAPVYEIGEAMTIGVRVSEDAYVYLFNVRSDGVVRQILPNNYDEAGRNNFVRAGETRLFPPQGARYEFRVAGPEGLDKVIAVASETPLDTSTLASFEADPNFASSTIGESGFAESLSVIVRPLPQEAWVSDTALFYVGRAAAAPRYGTLSITSEPSGAQVFIDDRFVGYTPLRYGAEAGNRLVNVVYEGYETYEATITVTGGETREVRANLRAQQRTGRVVFESDPQGAEVYVNGQRIGTTPTGAVTLPEGTHQARFVSAGFDEVTVSFTVNPGGTQRVSAELRAQVGALELQGNVGGAVVFLDGRRVGTLPSGTGRLTLEELEPGIHQLTVTAPGYSTYVSDVEVRAGETTRVQITQTQR
ncbi:PEGA domain-containing protein [Truepera radiovictrix]|uniref:PEGA domain protein n=1 Tax=Truepera radiovictrix (strain DSM 17093 / CIP 108686 / LMG 22925 / RQ-24) TaxID=649638 RepID=D7CQJ0_TRURR|nr:PEGA domain-containing protein [Truepera radiovictrix]ADI14974.1 PEGA domain protein [Truepera radiovictrix DSM 17093]WMT56471.1 PEGA domain-containing protein [Truepera radiovictrix]